MKNIGDAALAGETGTGWSERVLRAQQRKLFEAFLLFRNGSANDSVLEIGLRGPRDAAGRHAWGEAPLKSVVSSWALSPDGDLRLPYADRSFDWVFCSEVIEQLGSHERQQWLVAECYRVAREGVFITTPNRLHPFEFNTALPFVHWLPPQWWRRVLAWTGRSARAPLALLDGPRLYALAAALPGTPAHDVGHKRVFGIKAHFFLMIRKEA